MLRWIIMDIKEEKTPMTKIWAHRGASGIYPENTMPAFSAAADMHADGIELDIQLTKDGEIVVCHDETIDRTSNGTGNVKDLTLRELRKYDFSRLHPECGPVKIPTMREVFERIAPTELIRPTDLVINIELKTGVYDYEGIEEKILALTKEFDMNERVIYSSFNHYSMLRIRELCPEAHTAFLYADGPVGMPAYAKAHGMEAIHPWFVNLRYPDVLTECRQNGLKVHTWTVNTEEEALACFEQDVDALITNYPGQMLALRSDYERTSFRLYVQNHIDPWLRDHVTDGYLESFDGLSLHYYKAVHPQERGTIVMVHGFCEFFGKYHETACRFWDAGYTVWFLEVRGHGKSARNNYSDDQRVHVDDFGEYVSDLYSFMHSVVMPQTENSRIFLYAHSMGGAAGAMYLEEYPEDFRCAVLSSPMLKMDIASLPDPFVRAINVYSRISDKDNEYAPGQRPFTGENEFEHSSCLDEARYEYQLEQRRNDVSYQTWGGTWGWVSSSFAATETILKNADKVVVPVLICQAGRDNKVKNEGQDAFRRKCSHVTILVYPGSKHEIFNADEATRTAYYKDVLDFFSTFALEQAGDQ